MSASLSEMEKLRDRNVARRHRRGDAATMPTFVAITVPSFPTRGPPDEEAHNRERGPSASVAIVGRDTAAWLAANTLLKAPSAWQSVTGRGRRAADGPASASTPLAALPALEAFHRLLGFEES
jgi:hypothetical protein